MSFEYQNFATLGVNLNRQKYGPLDISSVFSSQKDLNYYLSKGALTDGVSSYWLDTVPYPYAGQVVALVNKDKTVQVFVVIEDENGTFKTSDIGAKVDLSNYSTTEEMNQAIEDAVNNIDLSNFITKDILEEAIGNIVIPENTDTKTTIVSGDNYVNVDGTLVDNANNTFTITINEESLKALIGSETTAAMEFKGAAHELPLLANKGDIYKVTDTFIVPAEQDSENKGFVTSVGDSIVCDGEGKWYLIPSGDDVEDTWRPVEGIGNESSLIFKAGDLLEVSIEENGNITYKHKTVNAPTKTEDNSGNREYITGFVTDEYGHIIEYSTAVENIVDTNDIYNAGNGIHIVDDSENTHTISVKVSADDKNLTVNENGLSTTFDLDNYATKTMLENEVSDIDADITKLSEKVDNKVEKVFYTIHHDDGTTTKVEGTLLTPEEKEKLAALSIDEDGSVGISGTVSVDNVQGLSSWITNNGSTYIQGLTEDNLSDDVNEKLNYITSVEEDEFTVENSHLKLKAVPKNIITGLNEELTGITNRLSAVEGKVLSLENNTITLEQFNKSVGNLENILASGQTIVEKIEELDSRLTWQELEL